MKFNSKLKIALACSIGLICAPMLGHDVPVHRAITINAVESAYANSPAFGVFINVISSDGRLFKDAANSMVFGSAHEDDPPGNQYPDPNDGGSYRSLNHFYDPLYSAYGRGLSDVPPDRRDVAGTNSFAWASISNCIGFNYSGYLDLLGRNENTSNKWSWQNARAYEWLGLTATNQLARQTNLDNMFRAVGQVMHLLEDTSQPQHVRNEQHVDKLGEIAWESPIEDYGNNNVTKLDYGDGSILDWRGDGFTKLEDFWDRHLYNGNSNALDAAENGGAQLGLAEWCNGNFLGQRHLYADYYLSSNIRYYPYPSLNGSTDYSLKRANLALGVNPLTLNNGQQVQAIYLKKTGAGVKMDYHSRFTYYGGRFPHYGMVTINDDNVLSNYHNLFIPKAVEYSAGLLDYFFRGTIYVTATFNANSNQYTFVVQNTSSQNFGEGSFFLVAEDTNNVRTIVQTNSFSTVPTGSSIDFTYSTDPPGQALQGTKFLVVYQGTVGVDGSGNAFDPVDTNICVAAAWPFEQTITYTYQPSLDSLGLTNGSTITSNLSSEDFYFTPTSGNYSVTINQAYFDDNGSIGCDTNGVGGISAPLATDCGWPHDPITSTVVPAEDVTIVGNHLQVNITATDNGCGVQIGWVDVSITWRAWPAP